MYPETGSIPDRRGNKQSSEQISKKKEGSTKRRPSSMTLVPSLPTEAYRPDVDK